MARLDEILSRYSGSESDLIPLLQEVQDLYGYLPEEAMEAIARFTGLSRTHVYGVATFYAQFRFKPGVRSI